MGKQYEIHQRIFQFVVRGLQVPRYFPKTIEAKIITDQYIRAITSVGANDNEADGALTKKDFLHCYTIVRKELKETNYWLKIISELFIPLKSRLRLLLDESQELIKIISTIINKTSKQ
jgi:four helix bundle protein